ncbi:hypothetical protein N7445_010782, partial [Penicillium cf. griseofulvum]
QENNLPDPRAGVAYPPPAKVQSDQLDFLLLVEWDEDVEYNEQPLRYMCYTIVWKLMFNRKKVGSVTKKDLILAPSDY